MNNNSIKHYRDSSRVGRMSSKPTFRGPSLSSKRRFTRHSRTWRGC